MITTNYLDPIGNNRSNTDLQTLMLGYLEPASIARAARVCKRWKQVANLPQLWQKLYQEKFGCLALSPRPGTQHDYKNLYKNLTILTSDIKQHLNLTFKDGFLEVSSLPPELNYSEKSKEETISFALATLLSTKPSQQLSQASGLTTYAAFIKANAMLEKKRQALDGILKSVEAVNLEQLRGLFAVKALYTYDIYRCRLDIDEPSEAEVINLSLLDKITAKSCKTILQAKLGNFDKLKNDLKMKLIQTSRELGLDPNELNEKKDLMPPKFKILIGQTTIPSTNDENGDLKQIQVCAAPQPNIHAFRIERDNSIYFPLYNSTMLYLLDGDKAIGAIEVKIGPSLRDTTGTSNALIVDKLWDFRGRTSNGDQPIMRKLVQLAVELAMKEGLTEIQVHCNWDRSQVFIAGGFRCLPMPNRIYDRESPVLNAIRNARQGGKKFPPYQDHYSFNVHLMKKETEQDKTFFVGGDNKPAIVDFGDGPQTWEDIITKTPILNITGPLIPKTKEIKLK